MGAVEELLTTYHAFREGEGALTMSRDVVTIQNDVMGFDVRGCTNVWGCPALRSLAGGDHWGS